jgi:glycosyltransferase involved in cell wall biosynthesis
MLTIIVPHKNTPLKLARLLRSIPIRPEIEVLVVDDASKPDRDASTVAEDFPHVTLLRNAGPEFNAGTARNTGLENRSNEWVVFADSDDYFAVAGIDVMLNKLSSVGKDADVVFFGVTSIDESNGLTHDKHQSLIKNIKLFLEESNETGVRYSWPMPWGKAFRSAFIEKNQLRFESVLVANDVMFSLKSGYLSKNVDCIEDIVYIVTRSEGTLTTLVTHERSLARLDVLIRFNNYLFENEIDIRPLWGVSHFIRSAPLLLNGRKTTIYGKYILCFIRTFFHRISVNL